MTSLELMTSKEVAKLLGVTQRYVASLARKGEIESAQKLPGKTGALLFDPKEVEHYRVMRELQTAGKGK